jgi:hypothetical protein
MVFYKLKPKLFQGKGEPFYRPFKDHLFKNVSLHDDGHILLECVDDEALTVDRFIHVDDLEKIESAEAEEK